MHGVFHVSPLQHRTVPQLRCSKKYRVSSIRSPTTLFATNDLFTISTSLPFPECHIIGIVQYVAFSDWLLSISNIRLRLVSVLAAWAHSILLLNTIPLSGYTIVCLLIHLLKDILLARVFGNYEVGCYKHSRESFCVDICFKFHWVKT